MHTQEQYPSQAERKQLLLLARHTIEMNVAKQRPQVPSDLPPILLAPGSSFVSLHIFNELRGCIGSLESTEPLYKNVMKNAINAAFKDPRFPPLTSAELPQVMIEISVLTPPRQIDSSLEFIVGNHGIILEKDQYRAVFLPQVAIHQGWNRETTLNFLSAKAGLPANAWRDSEAKLQIFEAIVFGEKE